MNDLTLSQEAKTVVPSVGVQRLVIQPGHHVPEEGVPVLALIKTHGDLGPQEWREVVYHDGDRWQSYAGSKTFDDGEQVARWVFAADALPAV